MKKYLKILGITCLVQGICMGLSILLSMLGESWDGFSTLVFFGALPASVLIDLIMSIRGKGRLGEKLACIFLMPTNYTGLLLLLWGGNLVGQWLHILDKIPANFG